MIQKTYILVAICAIYSLTSCNKSGIDNPEITKDELYESIDFLASDSLKGRKPGTPEGKLAAHYIGDKLLSFGYRSVNTEPYQYYDVITEVSATDNNSMSVNGVSANLYEDFSPFNFSANKSLESNVVFCGYGFNINTDSVNWDDYSLDVKDKWVLILRADPELRNPNSVFIPYSNDKSKVLTAKDFGASGVLFVSGVDLEKSDALIKPEIDQSESNFDLPVFHISRNIANEILKDSEITIEELEIEINKSLSSQSFETKSVVNATSEIIYKKVKTQNVVVTLEGKDPILKNEYILLGGHYDHLGLGGEFTSSRQPDTIAVHNGADDNASGIASLIEIAELLADNKDSLKRSIIIMAFGAEEIGILGSKHFTANPVIPLEQIKAMINIDMIGRLKESKDLLIGGVGTSIEGEELLNNLINNEDLELSFSYNGLGPSDHAAFYTENIPVFFFSTGAHEDYHTPNDDIQGINFEGLQAVSEFIGDLTFELINRESKLTFKEAGPKKKAGPTRGTKVKLGIMPNFGKSENNGLRVDGVTPGGPADLGGIEKGDVIVAIAEKPISNIYEYMARMGTLKPGARTTVEVIRNGENIILIIQLEE